VANPVGPGALHVKRTDALKRVVFDVVGNEILPSAVSNQIVHELQQLESFLVGHLRE
jgi:hypothetical protein